MKCQKLAVMQRGAQVVIFWLLTISSLELAQGADEVGDNPVAALPSSGKHSQVTIERSLNFHTDLFTGTFAYEIPIFAAPARQGTEPSIALTYKSTAPNDWCGVGWNIDVGHIQRDTTFGVPESDDDGFVFSVQGKQGKLVKDENNPNVYR